MSDVSAPAEVWTEVPGYGSAYNVSDLARARSLDRVIVRKDGRTQRQRGRMLAPTISLPSGYPVLSLAKNGVTTRWYLHELVLLSFVGPRPTGMVIRHLNGDPGDCRLENLAYGSPSQNQFDQVAHGTHCKARRTHCPLGHVLAPPNLVQSRLPYRICLACTRARPVVYWHQKRNLPVAPLHVIAAEKYAAIMQRAA